MVMELHAFQLFFVSSYRLRVDQLDEFLLRFCEYLFLGVFVAFKKSYVKF